MINNVKSQRDAFTFSLGGIRAVASFVAAPAIANDRINKILDDRLRQERGDRAAEPEQWLRGRRGAPQGHCA